jgi:hypothetical protein
MMDFIEQRDGAEARPPYTPPVLTTLGSFEQLTNSKGGTKTDTMGAATKAGAS